jgi:hypothetical protein
MSKKTEAFRQGSKAFCVLETIAEQKRHEAHIIMD